MSGWSLPESHGRWSRGSIAVRSLPPPPDLARRLVLRIVSVAPSDQPAPSVRVLAGGRLMVHRQGREGQEPMVAETALDLSEVEPEHGWLVLRFRVSDRFIPARLDRRGDPRRRGVLFVPARWAGGAP